MAEKEVKIKVAADVDDEQVKELEALLDSLADKVVGFEVAVDDEADTVGCCTLRVEHIKFPENSPNTITFDFLAKDSMRYLNTVKVEPIVYENLKRFVKGKNLSYLKIIHIRRFTQRQ